MPQARPLVDDDAVPATGGVGQEEARLDALHCLQDTDANARCKNDAVDISFWPRRLKAPAGWIASELPVAGGHELLWPRIPVYDDADGAS
jgi:hypothetical protein